MSFCTPVVSQVARTIFNEANPNIIKLLRAPVSHSRFPLVFRWDYLRPQRGAEGDISHVHIYLQGLVPFPVRQMVRLELNGHLSYKGLGLLSVSLICVMTFLLFWYYYL